MARRHFVTGTGGLDQSEPPRSCKAQSMGGAAVMDYHEQFPHLKFHSVTRRCTLPVGKRGSQMVLVSFNQGSKQDVEELCQLYS